MLALGLGLSKANSLLTSLASILIKAFKSRVATDSGVFEAENCLKTTLNNLNKI
jgi:hypothetical protein